MLLDARAAFEQTEERYGNRNLRRDQCQADDGPQQHRTYAAVVKLRIVFRAITLCDKTGRRHAKKCEGPIQKTEKHRREAHRADQRWVRKMPNYCRVDSARQWHGHVRENDRPGE